MGDISLGGRALQSSQEKKGGENLFQSQSILVKGGATWS